MDEAPHQENAQTTVDECQLCLDLLVNDRVKFLPGDDGRDPLQDASKRELCHLSVHGKFSTLFLQCDLEEVTKAEGMCAFCKHLRPHAWETVDHLFEVTLDSLPNIQSRQSACGLCSFIAKTSARMWEKSANLRIILRNGLPQGGVDGPYNFLSLCLQNGEDIHSNICWFQLYHTDGRNDTCVEAEPIVPELKEWADIRTKLDASLSPNPPLPRSSEFRVIDVDNKNVIIAPKDCEYVALSYVWGTSSGSKVYESSLANIDELVRPGGLQPSLIPATIRDAMLACSGLGKQYLWIDRFCILQDENNNPSKKQLEAIDQIYSQAFATLVAIEGDCADHGLFGVSRLKREPIYHGKIPFA